jgi:hypothetical protein
MHAMYHVGRNGQQTGPFSIDQLKAMAASGELNPTDLVWKEGMSGWEPASTLPGVFTSTPSSAPMSSMPASSATPPLAHASVLPPGGGQAPPNYLAFAIITTCCCLPFGIPAIVFATQVNSKAAAGDLAGAVDSSRKAKMWCWIAFGCGVLAAIAYAIFYGVAIAAAVAEEATKGHGG